MKMTIDLAIEELESTKDYPASDPASDEALDFAIDTMQKYQQIVEIVKEPCIVPEGCYPKLKKISEVVKENG